MIPEQITIEGFLSYKKRQTFRYPTVPVCLVNGSIDSDTSLSNGSGKSSLFEAIPVCLFGRIGGRAEVLDNYINDTMNFLYIEYIFLVDNTRYRTIFTRNRGASTKQEFYYDTNKTTLEEAKWKITDKKAEEILGLSFLTYSSTIYLNERDALKFIDGESGDRKEILRELLDAEIFEKALKVTNKKLDDLTKQIDINSTLIETKQTQLVDEKLVNEAIKSLSEQSKKIKENIKDNEKRLKNLEKEKNNYEVEIEKQKLIEQQIEQLNEDIENDQDSFKSLKTRIEALGTRIKSLKDTIKKNEEEKSTLKKKRVVLNKTIKSQKDELDTKADLEKKSKEITEFIQKLNKKLISSEQNKTKLESEIKQQDVLIEKIKSFKAVCPVSELQCVTLDSSYKDRFTSERIKIIEKVKIDLENVEKETENIVNELELKAEEQEKLLKQVKEKNDLKISIIENEKAFGDVENKENNLTFKNDEYLKQIEESEKEVIDNLEKTVKLKLKIETSETKVKNLKGNIKTEIKTELQNVKNSIDLINSNIEVLTIETNDLEKNIAVNESKLETNKIVSRHIKELQKSNESLSVKKKTFVSLVSIFGREGIQKSIISQAIPYLEKSSTELLKIFNNDSEKIKIKFDLDPKRSDGELKKRGGLDILVIESDKPPKDLRMYSGGERVRLIFSIILGLSKLLTRRTGKKHETLVIDEKIAKLDRKGIDQFIEVIDVISKWYKRIYIITHIEALKDVFDNEILINKTEQEGSVVVSTS